MKLNTMERLSNEYIKVDYQDELVQIMREGIYNMNQKALVNKFILRTFDKLPCEHEYVVLANSGLTNNFEYEQEEGKVNIYGIDIEYGPDKAVNYTTDLISVDFGQSNGEIDKTINYTKKSGLYVNLNTKKCYFVINDESITDGVNIIIGKNNINRLLQNCTLYRGYSWSNSEERNLRATFVNATKYDAITRYEKLNNQLGGSLEYWIPRTLTFKKIQKLAARNGLQNPGALYLGDFGNDEWGAMFLTKKIQGNADTTKEYHEYLNNRGIDLDDYIIDGQHIKNAAWLVDVLYKHHNIETRQHVVAGIMEQERAKGAGNKSAGVYEEEDIFNTILEYLKANYDYKIIGNPNKIAVIHDNNSAKIPNYDGKCFKSMVLDIATPSAQAYTSGQLLSKLMFINKEDTCTFLYNKLYNNLIDMTDITVEESEFSTTGSLSQMLFGLNPEMAKNDIYALTALGQDIMKYAKGAITKNKVKIKGSNYRAQFENTFMIVGNKDARLLNTTKEGYVECYNNDVLAKNRKEIRIVEKQYKEDLKTMTVEEARALRTERLNEFLVGMALKYPCPGNSEFELFRFLTKQEMKERAYDMFEETLADKVYRYFTYRNGGCIVIANENILKHKLAGMDTDFDGLTVVLEKELVDIAKQAYINGTITGYSSIPSYTVVLNKTKKDDKDFKIIKDCLSFKYRRTVEEEAKVIEEINMLNETILNEKDICLIEE